MRVARFPFGTYGHYMADQLPVRIAQTVDALRRAQGLSVRELHIAANIPNSSLARKLNIGDFKSSELERLAAVFGTTVSQITADAEAAA